MSMRADSTHLSFHPQRVKDISGELQVGKLMNIKASFALPKRPYGLMFLKDDVRFRIEKVYIDIDTV
ncbi:hypothetical protein C8Q72DRAFT_857446 [Fomitopsis betulina]|nr:hypothetical protein C8Q72DRAFT_857446 [Fomitopsis betulina]